MINVDGVIKLAKFYYCPKCGQPCLEPKGEKGISCESCGYLYYHNAASAAAGIIEHDGKILLVRRAHEPGRGRLDLPGGFADYNETLEQTLQREIREELAIEIKEMRYFGSAPNVYFYKGITYHTTDAYFICQPVSVESIRCASEVSELVWQKPQEIDLETIAFDSARSALKRYIALKQ